MADAEVKAKITTESDTKGVEQAEGALGKFGASLNRIGEIAAGVGLERLAEQFVDLTKKAATFAIDTGGKFEQWNMAFKSMLADDTGEKTAKLMSQISDFAQKTPFELPGLVEGSKQLIAFGVGADDVVNRLGQLGDISAAVGTDRLPYLIHAFGQVQAGQKMTARELNEFVMSGVPMLDALADHYTKMAESSGKSAVSVDQVRVMMEKGSISAKDVTTVLGEMTGKGGRFYDMMNAQSRTFNGIVSNIKDSVTRLALSVVGFDMMSGSKTFGQVLSGSLFDKLRISAQQALTFLQSHQQQITDFAEKAIGSVITFTENLIKTVQNLTKYYKEHKTIIDIVLVVIGSLIASLTIVATFFGTVSAAVTAFGIVMAIVTSPITLVVLAIAAVIAIGYLLITHWNEVKTVATNVWNTICSNIVSTISLIRETIKGFINEIINDINSVIKGANSLSGKLPGGKAIQIPLIPMLEKGTNFFEGGTALVGERGPELVELPRGSKVIPNNQVSNYHNGVTINQNNNIYSDLDMKKALGDIAYKLAFA